MSRLSNHPRKVTEWPDQLAGHDRTWWILSAGEAVLWGVTALYIVRGGFWWHFSGAGTGIVGIRSMRARRPRAQRLEPPDVASEER